MARHPRIGAHELAALLTEVCLTGISLRERGCCLGVDLARRVRWIHGELQWSTPNGSLARRYHEYRAVRHARSQHANGCLEIGVALAEVQRIAALCDGSSAAGYLCDEVQTVVASLSSQLAYGREWIASDVRELLVSAIDRSITRTGRAARGEALRPALREPRT